MTKAKAENNRPRTRDRNATETKILDVAEYLFAVHGFDAVSTKQLAATAGVTIGAIYHHFEGKEALYAAAARRAFSRGAIAPRELFDSVEPPEIRLEKQVEWFVRAIVEDRNFGLLLQRELLDPRTEGTILLTISGFREALEHFKDIMRTLVPDVDTDEAFASMLALCFGFANLKGIYAIAPGARRMLASSKAIAAHATRLLLVGLRPISDRQETLGVAQARKCSDDQTR